MKQITVVTDENGDDCLYIDGKDRMTSMFKAAF